MSKVEQSGRSSLRRPKLPIKGGSAPEEEEEEGEGGGGGGRRRRRRRGEENYQGDEG